MKPIEVRDCVLGISPGGFVHAGIQYIAQRLNTFRIHGAIDSSRGLGTVNVAPKKYPGLS